MTPPLSKLGSSDKSWNMICLTPTLHDWWGKAYFALKWLGDERQENDGYCSFNVTWQWLPRKIHEKLNSQFLERPAGDNYDTRARLDLDTEESYQAVKRAILESVQIPLEPREAEPRVPDKSGRTIQSGHIITLRVKKDDLEKVKTVLEAQWKLLQIAALSGAGEAPEELNPELYLIDFSVPLWIPGSRLRDEIDYLEEEIEAAAESPGIN